MTASVTTIEPARDGTPILTRRWAAGGPVWASILLVHGIAEHAGRYEHVGRQLAGAGLDVHAYDQRGFGGSGGRRAYVERWSVMHDDLEDRLVAVRPWPMADPSRCSGTRWVACSLSATRSPSAPDPCPTRSS